MRQLKWRSGHKGRNSVATTQVQVSCVKVVEVVRRSKHIPSSAELCLTSCCTSTLLPPEIFPRHMT